MTNYFIVMLFCTFISAFFLGLNRYFNDIFSFIYLLLKKRNFKGISNVIVYFFFLTLQVSAIILLISSSFEV